MSTRTQLLLAVVIPVILAIFLMPLMFEWLQGPEGSFVYQGKVVGMEYPANGDTGHIDLTLSPAGDFTSYSVPNPGTGKVELGYYVTIVCDIGPYNYPQLLRSHECQLVPIAP